MGKNYTVRYFSSGRAFSCKNTAVTVHWGIIITFLQGLSREHSFPEVSSSSFTAEFRLWAHCVQDTKFCTNYIPGCHLKIITDVSNFQAVAKLWWFWIELEGIRSLLAICNKRLYRQPKINTIFVAKSLFYNLAFCK